MGELCKGTPTATPKYLEEYIMGDVDRVVEYQHDVGIREVTRERGRAEKNIGFVAMGEEEIICTWNVFLKQEMDITVAYVVSTCNMSGCAERGGARLGERTDI